MSKPISEITLAPNTATNDTLLRFTFANMSDKIRTIKIYEVEEPLYRSIAKGGGVVSAVVSPRSSKVELTLVDGQRLIVQKVEDTPSFLQAELVEKLQADIANYQDALAGAGECWSKDKNELAEAKKSVSLLAEREARLLEDNTRFIVKAERLQRQLDLEIAMPKSGNYEQVIGQLTRNIVELKKTINDLELRVQYRNKRIKDLEVKISNIKVAVER